MRQRLQKILAQAGIGSRRSCEKLITEGRVCVNGVVVTKLGSQADPERDIITVDGEKFAPEKMVYILLNKPRGCLCTNTDPWGRRIVQDLLPGVSQRLYTVGRLDKDTEGIILITNDGQFAQSVAHPRSKVEKTYKVRISGALSREARGRLAKGIWLDGKRTIPARVRTVTPAKGGENVTLTISEGRKRQIKRMFLAVGCPVKRLKRVAIGGLNLGRLKSGNYRFLKRVELEKIFTAATPRRSRAAALRRGAGKPGKQPAKAGAKQR